MEFFVKNAVTILFVMGIVFGLRFLSKKAESISKKLGWDKDLDEESRKRKERMESIRNSSKEKKDEESQNQ